jgi:hypothetical protein
MKRLPSTGCCAFAYIFGVMHDFQMQIVWLEAAEEFSGPVDGAVIHGNHLCGGDRLGEGNGADAVEDIFPGSRFIEDWSNDR